MLITTFFIDKFKEVSIRTPSGIQEEGGVYGDETNYSSWVLGSNGDTADFEGIAKTNILYGELYKITLDTGNMFNPLVRGGTPNVNGFMNMDLNDYWANIVDDIFKFNNRPYSSFIRNQGNQSIYPTLMEYANSVKERIGWVEVNRTRTSIYYELCSGGKRARSDHFYDVNRFLMTAELFDTENQNNILNLSYQNVNPFTGGDERYYSNNPLGVSSVAGQQYNPLQRPSLTPIGSWFTWTNNAQGHFKSSNYTPDNIGGYLDIFPWPRGPMWGQYRGAPKDYLPALVTGNQIGLDADINLGPRQVKLARPSGIGDVVSNVPLLIAQKEKHLNTLLTDRLANSTQFGTLIPISSVYSVDIWGEKKLPEEPNIIQLGIISKIQTPSYGVCQPVTGIDTVIEKKDGDTISISDPFGMGLYQLDKEYEEVYSKFKFCPPRKKIKNSLEVPLPKNTSSTSTVVKKTTGNLEEYVGMGQRIVKIGAFNPDENLGIDLEDDQIIKGATGNNKLSVDLSFFQVDYKKIEDMSIEDVDVYNKKTKETSQYSYLITGDRKETDYLSDTGTYEKTKFISRLNQLSLNDLEIENGVRSEKQPMITDHQIPYGTYSYKKEINTDINGNDLTTIKLMRNGSDADPAEFKNAVKEITSLAENDKIYPEPIGVSSNGFPIFPKDTLESSMIKIKEDLTGVKEIIFRGSDVNLGAIHLPRMINRVKIDPQNPETFATGVSKVVQYVNTGISSKGVVDLNTGEKLDVGNLYKHKVFRYIEGSVPANTNSLKFFSDKEKNLKIGEIDFIGKFKEWETVPSISTRNQPRSIISLNEVEYIIVSKFDTLGVRKDYWGSTVETPTRTPILSAKTGSLFLIDTVGNINQRYIFEIIGQTVELDAAYKIPVKFSGGVPTGTTSVVPVLPGFPGEKAYSTFTVKYSKESGVKKEPSQQSVKTDVTNTYGGWRFSGLWHRDGTWPVDHVNRSGLLGGTGFGDVYWDPSQGGVNTGAWIKVPKERVRLEYHSFGEHSEESIKSYIHRLWLSHKDRLFLSEQERNRTTSPNYELKISPFSDALDNQLYSADGFVHPLNRVYEPNIENSNNWEDWESRLDFHRTGLIDSLNKINSKVLVMYLRDNMGDVQRGISPLNNRAWYWGGNTRYFTSDDVPPNWKEGHIMEQWIIANKITDDQSIMDSKDNYWIWWYPEPTEHTMGMFKPDEWYRAVFVKAVTSPTNPNGELAGFKKYPVNDFNKKTFCDLLYLSEQILKMHRARLVELKKYIDNREKFYGDINDNGVYTNPSFRRNMSFVQGFRKIINLFK